MFELDPRVAQWRRETEATLAFSADELDELEDHLRLCFEARLAEGLTPEQAWPLALGQLGPASALALEFAKDKLMPAALRLFTSWGPAALLMCLFGLTTYFSVPMADGTLVGKAVIAGLAEATFIMTIIFLPGRARRNAVIVGVGNAVCLVLPLNAFFFNRFTDRILDAGRSHFVLTLDGWAIALSLASLALINLWWWKRSRPEDVRAQLPLAAVLVALLALSPFLTEIVGSLSIRYLYGLPTLAQMPSSEASRNDILKFKMEEALVVAMSYVLAWLPLLIMALLGFGTLLVQGLKGLKTSSTAPDSFLFPSARDVPWLMTLAAVGWSWVVGHSFERSYSTTLYPTEEFVHLTRYFSGMEVMALAMAAIFLICAFELTKALFCAPSVRPFYAAVPIVVELAVASALLLLPIWGVRSQTIFEESSHSAEPAWFTWALFLAVIIFASIQFVLIWKKTRHAESAVSFWIHNGGDLVRLGLQLGLILACSGLLIFMTALVMGCDSTIFITSLIEWGNSITKPLLYHFNPHDYGPAKFFSFFLLGGITYVSFCLALGLALVVILSGLEFIRFNGFRLYRLRRSRHEAAQMVALSE